MIEIFPNGDGSIRVSCSKSKDEEHWMDQQFSFQQVLNSGVLVPSVGYATLQYSEQEIHILEFLALETFKTSGAKAIQIMNALNIPERTIYRLLSHLKTDCQIDQGKRGDPYCLTDDGRDTLRHRSAISPDTMEIQIEQ
jgi:predicted transcriptional regulator